MTRPSPQLPQLDTLALPGLATCLSISVLVLHVASSLLLTYLSSGLVENPKRATVPSSSGIREYVERLGGPTIVGFNFIRVLACISLVGLSSHAISSKSSYWIDFGLTSTFVSHWSSGAVASPLSGSQFDLDRFMPPCWACTVSQAHHGAPLLPAISSWFC